MARPSTGAWNVYESIRLELPWLLKKGYIQKGRSISTYLTWTNQHGHQTASMGFKSLYTDSEASVEVSYDRGPENGPKTPYRYKVYLHRSPSNLGKG